MMTRSRSSPRPSASAEQRRPMARRVSRSPATVMRYNVVGKAMTLEELARAIKRKAEELGFDLCGIAPAVPSAFKAEYRAWLDAGYHGEMHYLSRNPERRLDPSQLLPGAKSIVVVGMNYYTEADADTDDPTRAVFARYARNEDYHDVITPRLRNLLAFVQERNPKAHGKVYVDTGPILEREVARLAGLGWFGKNTMLINTRRGSYFLLGELILDLELPSDRPAVGGCGTCRKCIDACPTGAIVEPFKLDARRCISYLTIEFKGPIPDEFRSKIGNRIFGCDICQEVCPFNLRRARPTDEPALQPREITKGPRLSELANMTEEEFRLRFRGSAVKRAKWKGLVRNVAAALSSGPVSGAEARLSRCETNQNGS